MQKHACSCIIVAAGIKPADALVALLADRCREIILVASDPLRHLDFNGLIVAHRQGRCHPFSAIHAGLSAARHDHAVVVDGRRPELEPALLQGLLGAVEPRWDLVIAKPDTGPDPCLAVYSRRCLKPMAEQMARDVFNADVLLSKLNTHVIAQELLQTWDPRGISFKRGDCLDS